MVFGQEHSLEIHIFFISLYIKHRTQKLKNDNHSNIRYTLGKKNTNSKRNDGLFKTSSTNLLSEIPYMLAILR